MIVCTPSCLAAISIRADLPCAIIGSANFPSLSHTHTRTHTPTRARARSMLPWRVSIPSCVYVRLWYICFIDLMPTFSIFAKQSCGCSIWITTNGNRSHLNQLTRVHRRDPDFSCWPRRTVCMCTGVTFERQSRAARLALCTTTYGV